MRRVCWCNNINDATGYLCYECELARTPKLSPKLQRIVDAYERLSSKNNPDENELEVLYYKVQKIKDKHYPKKNLDKYCECRRLNAIERYLCFDCNKETRWIDVTKEDEVLLARFREVIKTGDTVGMRQLIKEKQNRS